jgi:hypothetical protein
VLGNVLRGFSGHLVASKAKIDGSDPKDFVFTRVAFVTPIEL